MKNSNAGPLSSCSEFRNLIAVLSSCLDFTRKVTSAEKLACTICSRICQFRFVSAKLASRSRRIRFELNFESLLKSAVAK